MKNFIVYKHTSPNGKVYIGITKQNPKQRWGNGSGYRQHKYFANAIKKHGWENFKHEILFNGLTEDEAKLMEQCLIALYDSINPKYGYNRTLGGEGTLGHQVSDETRVKISKATKGIKKEFTKEHCRHIGESRKGKKLSKETKIKMSKNHADVSGENNPLYGKKHSEEAKRKMSENHDDFSGSKHPQARKVICITTGKVFCTIKEASEFYNIDSSSISACCRHKAKTVSKLKWMYYEEYQRGLEKTNDDSNLDS